MSPSLGIIGFGRIAQAIVLPLLEKGELLPESVFSIVGSQDSVKDVSDKFPEGIKVVAVNDPIENEVWNAPILLLAVKPNQLNLVKQKVQKREQLHSSEKPLLISVLAGVKLENLELTFPDHVCVRAVPNAPMLVGEGLIGLSWGRGVTAKHKQTVQKLFQSISESFELPEIQMDAFLALTSSGPAYIALIIEALSDGAVASGLPRPLADNLAVKTVLGTTLLLKRQSMHPALLKDMVASPKGTTISGLRHLEKAGLRSSLIEAVVVAAERSRSMN